MRKKTMDQLLLTGNYQFQKLNKIVLKAIEEEKLLSQKLLEFEDPNPPFSGRIADRVAAFGGSWKFIITFLSLMLTWIVLNLYFLSRPFDLYPFILLNLLLSTVAALQAPVIMMSQNRKEEKDRQRAVNDYLINLKAEVEIRNMHEKLDLLMTEQMKTLFEIQKEQINMMNEIKADMKKDNNNTMNGKHKPSYY
ncbi:MAG: DUF1003 domain-containing protein [Chitinophagaceae bacterium]